MCTKKAEKLKHTQQWNVETNHPDQYMTFNSDIFYLVYTSLVYPRSTPLTFGAHKQRIESNSIYIKRTYIHNTYDVYNSANVMFCNAVEKT